MAKSKVPKFKLSSEDFYRLKTGKGVVMDGFCEVGYCRHFTSEDETEELIGVCTSWWGYRGGSYGGCYSSCFKLKD